jgi:ankyrin repeat protein
MWAAGQGHADTVALLLARGADAARRDDRGLSAADIARQAGHVELAARLVTR